MAALYDALPDDDAPISEWCRPLSATVNTRGNNPRPPVAAARKPPRKVTLEIVDDVHRILREGGSLAEAAKRCGIGKTTAHRIANGFSPDPKRGRKYSAFDMVVMARVISTAEIARRAGITRRGVQLAIQRFRE